MLCIVTFTTDDDDDDDDDDDIIQVIIITQENNIKVMNSTLFFNHCFLIKCTHKIKNKNLRKC